MCSVCTQSHVGLDLMLHCLKHRDGKWLSTKCYYYVSRDPRWKVMFKSRLIYHSFKIHCSNADSGRDPECSEARKFGSSCWSLNSEFPNYTVDVSHWAVKRQAVTKADGNCMFVGLLLLKLTEPDIVWGLGGVDWTAQITVSLFWMLR